MEMLVKPHGALERFNGNTGMALESTAVIPVALERQSCTNPGSRDSGGGNKGDLTTTLVA